MFSDIKQRSMIYWYFQLHWGFVRLLHFQFFKSPIVIQWQLIWAILFVVLLEILGSKKLLGLGRHLQMRSKYPIWW